jgi:hypothetical protein
VVGCGEAEISDFRFEISDFRFEGEEFRFERDAGASGPGAGGVRASSWARRSRAARWRVRKVGSSVGSSPSGASECCWCAVAAS